MKVMKAYKLCRLGKDGKIYPLYVLANNPLPIGVWLEAEEGIMASDNKHVKSRLGNLAFRPGYHMISMPRVFHLGMKLHKEDKLPSFRNKEHVWCECSVDTTIHYEDYRAMKAIPKNGYYKFKTNPNARDEWYIAGRIKIDKVLTDEEVHEINSIDGIYDMPREK